MSGEEPYFALSTLLRDLPAASVQRLGAGLMVDDESRNWKMLGSILNFQMHELDHIKFQATSNNSLPGVALLRAWSLRDGSNLNVLRESFRDIGRDDLVVLLDKLRWNQIRLIVAVERAHTNTYDFDVEIRGRIVLQDALFPGLEEFVTKKVDVGRCQWIDFRFIGPHTGGGSLVTEAHAFLGQQVTFNAVVVFSDAPINQTIGSRLNPKWRLIDDNTLRYTPASESSTLVTSSDTTVTSSNIPSGSSPGAETTRIYSRGGPCDEVASNHPLCNGDQRVCDHVTNTVPRRQPVETCDFSESLVDDFELIEDDVSPNRRLSPVSSLGASGELHAIGRGLRQEDYVAAELNDLPAYHAKLGNSSSEIKKVLCPVQSSNGMYVVRSFQEPVSDRLQMAISVTFQKKIKHFHIHQGLNPRLKTVCYYLFQRDYQAPTIRELLEHYTENPLIPSSGIGNTELLHPNRDLKLLQAVPERQIRDPT